MGSIFDILKARACLISFASRFTVLNSKTPTEIVYVLVSEDLFPLMKRKPFRGM